MKTIKQNLIIIALILSSIVSAQEQLSISLSQDARLGILGDKEHGYNAGTINVLVKLKMSGNQQKYGFLSVYPEFEYAAIQGDYYRYSANVGYTFNKLLIENLEAGSFIGYGIGERNGLTWDSFSLNGELAYKLSSKIKLLLNAQFVQRKDLELMYNDNNVIRFSGFFGIEFKII
jgi:hypothetical protein